MAYTRIYDRNFNVRPRWFDHLKKMDMHNDKITSDKFKTISGENQEWAKYNYNRIFGIKSFGFENTEKHESSDYLMRCATELVCGRKANE